MRGFVCVCVSHFVGLMCVFVFAESVLISATLTIRQYLCRPAEKYLHRRVRKHDRLTQTHTLNQPLSPTFI